MTFLRKHIGRGYDIHAITYTHTFRIPRSTVIVDSLPDLPIVCDILNQVCTTPIYGVIVDNCQISVFDVTYPVLLNRNFLVLNS
jgi:hypothetical protein